jgi:hypothetical protein
MAAPNSRQTLIDFCLRRLGAPVLEINVDDDQIQDKVDDALQVYQEFHSDATLRTYMKHVVTADDVTNKYIPIPADIVYISKMFPVNSTFSGAGMFDVKYQMMLNSMGDFVSFAGGMSYFYQMQQYLSMVDMQLSGTPQVSFSRHQDRLYVFGDFNDGDIKVGDFLVAEVYQIVNPDSSVSIYNDMFIKNYTTSLIKQQWGLNMMKFDGMQLPGGVTVNGRQMYDDGTQELEKLKEDMRLEQELPPDFFIG